MWITKPTNTEKPHRMKRFLSLILAAIALSMAPGVTAQEQTTPPAAGEPAATVATDAEAVSDVERRLRRLEDAVIDMQAVVGALETMVQTGDGAKPSPSAKVDAMASSPLPRRPTAGPADGDLATLEIQLRAMSSQLADIAKRLNRLEAHVGLTVEKGPDIETPGEHKPKTGFPGEQTTFGETSVEPQDTERVLREPAQRRHSSEAEPPATADARAFYDSAYELLQRRDFPAAQRAFTAFLERYPDDALAVSARFWLGEAAFVNGDYERAADMFLKTYNADPDGDKAGESLLKLGISFRRLGQLRKACEAFLLLHSRIGNAPEDVRQMLEQERRRAGC